MKLPIETKPALWGAAGGAVALAILGFGWGNWTTGAKAETLATHRANTAVVTALAPICADRCRKAVDMTANTEALKNIVIYDNRDMINFLRLRDGAGAKSAMSIHIRHVINTLGLNASEV